MTPSGPAANAGLTVGGGPHPNPNPSPNPGPNPNPKPSPSPNPNIRTGDVFDHAIVKNAAPFGLFVDVGVGAHPCRNTAPEMAPSRPH